MSEWDPLQKSPLLEQTKAPDWLKQRRAPRIKGAQGVPSSPEVVNNSPPEPVVILQDEPLVVGTAEGYELRVIVTKEPSKDVTWAIALLIAVFGIGMLFLGVLPGETVYQEIAWLLIILILVIAIKR